ncbi:MAG: hypothetical protein ACD_45C00115G0007 [uncultured bacterium]|nr:MAG: hypothetical protein ACD_45C00115G0007 [uncultured bacterium]
MLEEKKIHYYFFAFANFLAALGGGMILGKGIGIVNIPLLQGSSILAFFLGSALGLLFLQLVPKKKSINIARWFSLLGAFSSVILFCIFERYAENGKLFHIPAVFFFIFLSARFGFWFYSRVLRASKAAGKQQQIAWVELGYYLGMILGLIIWDFLGINIAVGAALLLDAFLQCSAGIFDLFSNQLEKSKNAAQINQSDELKTPVFYKNAYAVWGWRLAIAVVLLTIGNQVIIFNLVHQTSEWFGVYMIACYYCGVSMAALVCKKYNIQLDWDFKKSAKSGYAVLYVNAKKMSFVLSSVFSLACVAMVVVGILYWHWNVLTFTIHNLDSKEILLLTIIMLAAFFYEVLALSLLDRIGLEDKLASHPFRVMRTYGLIAIAAAIVFWMLGIIGNSVSHLFVMLTLCLVMTHFMVWKRELHTLNRK